VTPAHFQHKRIETKRRLWPQFQPMPLLKRHLPFDHADWIFELKYDGFRALLVVSRAVLS
jgi:ATP-dependent DNA ligase